jgi:hypothetical protein
VGFVEIIGLTEEGAYAGYPAEPTPEPSEPAELMTVAELSSEEYSPRPRIGIRALHTQCTKGGSPGYRIDVKRARTLEEWVAWVLHLQEKAWMGRADLMRMLSYWWSNRGEQRPSLPS